MEINSIMRRTASDLRIIFNINYYVPLRFLIVVNLKISIYLAMLKKKAYLRNNFGIYLVH